MGSPTGTHVSLTAHTSAKQPQNMLVHGIKTRTSEKCEVATFRLETIWKEKLIKDGWTERSATQMSLGLAPSTLALYNRILQRLKSFCEKFNYAFPPDRESNLVDFLCEVADRSERPKSQLNCTLAALSKLYKALDLPNLTTSESVKGLVTALIKTQTSQPRSRSSVMPVAAFVRLFTEWPENKDLSIERLRLKTIVLLALTLMLRPSDIAPKAVRFEPASNTTTKVVFSTKCVRFNEDGSIQITFFGIKNDTDRSGAEVLLPPSRNQRIDPVGTLKCYIERTEESRSEASDKAVFLPLKPPFHAICASTVATILEDGIVEAGLGGQGFTAKDFRPTGATLAIESNQAPDIVMKVGRWKTSSVFYGHYVHARTPDNFTGAILMD